MLQFNRIQTFKHNKLKAQAPSFVFRRSFLNNKARFNFMRLYHCLVNFLTIRGSVFLSLSLLNHNISISPTFKKEVFEGFNNYDLTINPSLTLSTALFFLKSANITLPCKTTSINPPLLLKTIVELKQELSLNFVVRYRQINRKLRKIVKNKYKYVRVYEFIRRDRRWFWGLRLLKLSLSFDLASTFKQRLENFFLKFFRGQKDHPFFDLKNHYHMIALRALIKK